MGRIFIRLFRSAPMQTAPYGPAEPLNAAPARHSTKLEQRQADHFTLSSTVVQAAGNARSRVALVAAQAEGLELDVQTHTFPTDAAYRQKFPLGLVPTLEKDDFKLSESVAVATVSLYQVTARPRRKADLSSLLRTPFSFLEMVVHRFVQQQGWPRWSHQGGCRCRSAVDELGQRLAPPRPRWMVPPPPRRRPLQQDPGRVGQDLPPRPDHLPRAGPCHQDLPRW